MLWGRPPWPAVPLLVGDTVECRTTIEQFVLGVLWLQAHFVYIVSVSVPKIGLVVDVPFVDWELYLLNLMPRHFPLDLLVRVVMGLDKIVLFPDHCL